LNQILRRIVLVFCAAALVVFGQKPDAKEIASILAEISEITGIPVKRQVPFDTMTRDQWKGYIEEQIKERVKPEEIRAEELVLKKFGLVPQDYDLKASTVELLTEQAAAFYDHRKKKMVLLEGNTSPALLNSMVLTHELAHALADQYVDLRKFIEKADVSDEGTIARLAVAEGQAMWIMLETPMRKMGGSLLQNPAALEMMKPMSSQMASGMFPVFEKAPLYIRESLMFPYAHGLMFQHAVLEKMGKKGFLEVLRNPPVTTQQVIHPELYLDKLTPLNPALPPLERASDYKLLTEGTLGEFDFSVLLRQYVKTDSAAKEAENWRGGRYELHEHKKDGYTVLRWSAEWKTAESARQILGHVREIIAGKSKDFRITEEGVNLLAGRTSEGEFRIQVDGSRVQAQEGLPVRR